MIKVRNDFNKPRRRSNRGRHVAPPTCARLHPWRRSSSTTTRRSTLPSTSHSSLVYSLQQRFNAGIALYCLISHSLSWHPRTETCRNFFNAGEETHTHTHRHKQVGLGNHAEIRIFEKCKWKLQKDHGSLVRPAVIGLLG